MKILVLEGGSSNEREISLRSSKNIKNALNNLGHDVIVYDPINGIDNVKNYVGKVDLVFPILHGGEGENGVYQARLEEHGFKYLGSDSFVSDLCWYKPKFKKAVEKLEILLPNYEIVTAKTFKKSNFIKKPFVLKPLGSGSSIDVFIVRDPKKIPKDVYRALKEHNEMIVEELIEGIEITIPVLGKKALPVIEIIPPINQEFDYENKYNGKTAELCPPKNVSKKIQKDAQKMAEVIHNGLNMRHLSRLDMIVTPNNELYVIETNTIPGLTDQSLFPKSAKETGMSIEALVEKFVQMTLDGI